MHHNFQEQLSAIDEDMIDAVINDNEMMIAELQQRRQQIEHLIFGDETIA